jgi:hypothetical protein
LSIDAANGTPTQYKSRTRRLNRYVSLGLAVSLVVHLLVAVSLFWGKEVPKRAGRAAPRHAVVIALTLDSFTTHPSPPTPPMPPKPAQDQASERAPKPRPAPAHTAAAPQKSAAPSRDNQAKNQVEQPDDTDEVLGRIHDNWLEPPGINRNFHCRVQIDYVVGGSIVEVRLLEGCGSPMLDDSVKRAVWKTQPLPVASARKQAGRLEIDFSP